ncbi:MAG: adenosylmethionine--8-amino-7-oxononanoate transaminase [Gammaproteobacteria bacterium]|nr:adenosylmethionine--8-amino-7-oxononanoate transaminase [Gammaproteobacteria bacterium]
MTTSIDYTDAANWLAYDVDHIWHPYTNVCKPSPVFPVVAAEGVMIELADGRRLVDGMASWWAAIHGYNQPVLNQAIETQLKSMSHIMFGGLTHEPAVRLAETLINITADSLQHVFLADSGSVSVEVAMKMALQYQLARGNKNKTRLLSFRNAYHGDTFGAMSVCDPVNGMHSLFQGVLAQHYFADAPICNEQGQADNFEDFENLIRRQHNEIAAVILEPMVQGAGGMRMYCADYLHKVRALCDELNVLLILDEIATGFGRTGKLFAYEHAGIRPDILCLGKALTGGYMTLAATLTSRHIAETIGGGEPGNLMHGPTFMANPLACSVASASINLLLASPWQARIDRIEKQMRAELQRCQELSAVKNVRVMGAIGVVELQCEIDMHWIQPRFVELGVWLRPFNNLIYIMPPYIIETEQLSKITSAIFTVVTELSVSK